jgi:uncharacterized repeat protein (TIGR03803 family)
MKRIVIALSEINSDKKAIALLVLWVATAVTLPGQTFNVLYGFCSGTGCTGPSSPEAALVQATDGSLYGTAAAGGTYGYGAIFRITPDGALTSIYSFCPQAGCADGIGPNTALVQASNGDFYGTTVAGGSTTVNCFPNVGCGTVFKITPNGTLTTLYRFCSLSNCADGVQPNGVIQATDGNFYGTTFLGGSGSGDLGSGGTLFRITPGGALTTLYNFCAVTSAGCNPQAGLVQASDGNLYGTTFSGGTHLGGTIFKRALGGTLTTLYNFCSQAGCTDGEEPAAPLIQASDGDLYGTTYAGGASGDQRVNSGSIFKISLGGTLTTLYSFCANGDCTTGADLKTGLLQGTDGNFYGTQPFAGPNGGGSVFQVTQSGNFTTLHRFCPQNDCPNGATPEAGLAQDTNGKFYGSVADGGTGGGALFTISMGLGPFVEPQTDSGKVGASVKILGTDLTGATSVTFNGIAAAFTVVSASEIEATVPAGATTGMVQVVTPNGTLSSNVSFRVP